MSCMVQNVDRLKRQRDAGTCSQKDFWGVCVCVFGWPAVLPAGCWLRLVQSVKRAIACKDACNLPPLASAADPELKSAVKSSVPHPYP